MNQARRFLATSVIAIVVTLASGTTAFAQHCWVRDTATVNFGAVALDAPANAQSVVTLTCQGGAAAATVRYCVFVAEGQPLAGVGPRRMTNYNGAELRYDLYSDASRTNIIGPPPAGGGFPGYEGLLAVGANVQAQADLPIYGRVPAGQNVPATAPFQAQLLGSTIAFAFATGRTPLSCTAGDTVGSAPFYMDAKASIASGCRFTSVGILDFGATSRLSSAIEAATQIVFWCPTATPWSLSLDAGQSPVGQDRTMRVAGGSAVKYEIFKDAARTQRWGSSGGDAVSGVGAGQANPISVNVFGRVPTQPERPPGAYADNVIVTLTY